MNDPMRELADKTCLESDRNAIALLVLPSLARMIDFDDKDSVRHFHSPESGASVAFMWADAFVEARDKGAVKRPAIAVEKAARALLFALSRGNQTAAESFVEIEALRDALNKGGAR